MIWKMISLPLSFAVLAMGEDCWLQQKRSCFGWRRSIRGDPAGATRSRLLMSNDYYLENNMRIHSTYWSQEQTKHLL
ncbi:hypothetical protein BDV18DRAFT_146028 [Aspergillus unguis]